MHYTSLLVAATGLLASAVAATPAPTCISSADGYQVGQVVYLFNTFCKQLESNKFASQKQVYGQPFISFEFSSTSSSKTGDLNSCLASYQTLVTSCALPNSTIWGTGSIDAGYGLYNFSIWSTAEYPASLGPATTTILGATLTTAPIITLTSTSSSSYSLISTSSSPSSSPMSTSASLTPSSSLVSSVYYSNGTSTSSSAYASASGSGASASVTGSPIVPVTSATATKTKPAAATGSSGAEMVKSGGFSIIALACVGAWLF